MDKSVIEAAKQHAREQDRSLSNLVETYLKAITSHSPPEKEEIDLPPIVKSLKGSVKVPESFDYKEELYKALSEKYL